jgi:hypothetical protein
MRYLLRGGLCSALAGGVLGISLSLVPTAAHAETWKGLELERKLQTAAWHFGPFRIQPSLVISNAGVDSNVFYSPTEPIKDYTITAGPAATLYIPVHRKFVLSLYGSPQYVWYSKTDRERTWNYYFNGAVQLSLKNVFFSLEGTYSDARERWNTEIDIRPRRKEKGYGGSVLVKVAWKTSFSLAYRTAKYDYESVDYAGGFNLRERLNRRESYANFSLFYQATTERRFFLDFEYGLYEFEFATQAAIGDSRSGAAFAGLEFSQLGRRVHGRIRVGYKKYDVRSVEGLDYEGVVGDSQLWIRLAKPFVIRGSYVRDVRFSLWYGNPYYIESRPGVGVSLYPLRFLRLDYDYSLGRNRYSLAGGGGPDVKRLDDYTTHSAGIYVRIRKTVALGFIASWWARNSNIAAEDDKRTFFGLNLTYDF